MDLFHFEKEKFLFKMESIPISGGIGTSPDPILPLASPPGIVALNILKIFWNFGLHQKLLVKKMDINPFFY